MRRRWLGMVLIASLAVSGTAQGLESGRDPRDYDTPIIILPEEICEIEITPTEVSLLIDQPLNFYEMYLHLMICEPPPPQYKCKGCKDKNKTFYECYHEVMNPRVRCDKQRCIKNEVRVKDCYVSGNGREDCRVLVDPVGNPDGPEGNFAVQTVIELPSGRECNPPSQEPRVVMQHHVGCPRCDVVSHEGRCIVEEATCRGKEIERSIRQGRFLCSPNPCPNPRGTEGTR